MCVVMAIGAAVRVTLFRVLYSHRESEDNRSPLRHLHFEDLESSL